MSLSEKEPPGVLSLSLFPPLLSSSLLLSRAFNLGYTQLFGNFFPNDLTILPCFLAKPFNLFVPLFTKLSPLAIYVT